MKQNAQFSSRITIASISPAEICFLICSIILGIISIHYEIPLIYGIYIFTIFLPIGLHFRNIKAELANKNIRAALIFSIINLIVSLSGYWPAFPGIILYIIIILHRHSLYKKLTGG
jgi:hypothetical protein